MPIYEYTESERKAAEEHIESYFGRAEAVLHEILATQIQVDIYLIPPVKGREYYTLVTLGMGAYPMNVPEDLAGHGLERAELMITLPPDWKVRERDETWDWPIRLLGGLACLPMETDSWLGWGHTMDNEVPFAENTELSAAMLIEAQALEGSEIILLPTGELVNFYQILPLYPEELEEKLTYGADNLLAGMAEMDHVVSIDRPRASFTEADYEKVYEKLVMDDMRWHLESIRQKCLPVEEITACNHLAIYLRWCVEHHLMSENFLEQYGKKMAAAKTADGFMDLRPLVQQELCGVLLLTYFNEEGMAFARHYYIGEEEPCFPEDVDGHAMACFGRERYESDEFQDEAYLFVPFDEAYYQSMAEIIEKRWEKWREREGR
ncbi:suppressor of fused domain protein [Anaerotignum lactatifermentans]|uniref:Suppressor of fused domain protein n=1 Tax=Anaerotignum lactatifermentans TaxID=160404 RepID=A0ABS2G8W2_9FIRM|nr:suppressor of fused domain protein [Anaerotignum lactatifermentans]MBM6828829.1 suppressor of fused domain protein [Anaerotignum lactatifermentans]MBM6876998.1 suppressor of fused domain protein [Anaerotignum lactatifermentans]MBM6950556.1 suppressor of fused domain protein [Anaerotignum lactatifermentans]